MEVICLILSVCALLIAAVSTYRFSVFKKRSETRYSAIIDYVGTMCENVSRSCNEYTDASETRVLITVGQLRENATANFGVIESRIKDLESGVVPDYETAKKSVDAVNNFSAGVAAILGFDPMAAAKQIRQNEGEA